MNLIEIFCLNIFSKPKVARFVTTKSLGKETHLFWKLETYIHPFTCPEEEENLHIISTLLSLVWKSFLFKTQQIKLVERQKCESEKDIGLELHSESLKAQILMYIQ